MDILAGVVAAVPSLTGVLSGVRPDGRREERAFTQAIRAELVSGSRR
ncbi:hypothetical protein [Crossiella sp. CA198]